MEKKIIEKKMKCLSPESFYDDQQTLNLIQSSFNEKAKAVENIIFKTITHDILGENNDISVEVMLNCDARLFYYEYETRMARFIENVRQTWEEIDEDEKDMFVVNYLSLSHYSYLSSSYHFDRRYDNYGNSVLNLSEKLQEKLLIQKFYFMCYLIHHALPINPFTINALTKHVLSELFEYSEIDWTIGNVIKTNKKGLNNCSSYRDKVLKLEEFLMIYYVIKHKKRNKSIFFSINGLSNLPKYYSNPSRQDGVLEIIDNMIQTVRNNWINSLLSCKLTAQ